MAKQRNIYSYGPIGIPSVLVALSGIALWFTWSGLRQPAVSAVVTASQPRVAYARIAEGDGNLYMKPDLFSRPSSVGFRVPEREEQGPLAVSRSDRTPMLLGWEETVGEERTGIPATFLPTEVNGHGRDYHPSWHAEAAFPRRTWNEVQVSVTVGKRLKERGFEIPRLPPEILAENDDPWMVIAHVDIGPDGRVSHVFIEKGSGDPKIDDIVTRTMQSGRLPQPGERCSGRVTVNLGRR